METQGVALGKVGHMIKHDAIAFTVYVASPVAVTVLAVVPMILVAVVVHVPGVIGLDLANAEVLKVPADGLTKREAVFRAVVGIGRAAERDAVWLALVDEIVDVSGEDVAPPAGCVARHQAKAVVRIQRIVPVGYPENGDIPHAHPGILDRGRMPFAIREIARKAPVEAAVLVRAGCHQRMAPKLVATVRTAADTVRLEAVGTGNRLDAARGDQFARGATSRQIIAADGQLLDRQLAGLLDVLRLVEKRLEKLGLRNGGEGNQEGGEHRFHVRSLIAW